MIKDYKYIEIYPEETMRKIIRRVNYAVKPLIAKWIEEDNVEVSIPSIQNLWTDCKEKKNIQTRQLTTLYKFSQFLEWVQEELNLKKDSNLEILCDTEVLFKELELRGIIHQDFEEEYPELMNKSIEQIFKGVTNPNWKQLRALTKMIEDSDDLTLDLPPAIGKRWDMDEWIRTSNIKKKESWEQQYD